MKTNPSPAPYLPLNPDCPAVTDANATLGHLQPNVDCRGQYYHQSPTRSCRRLSPTRDAALTQGQRDRETHRARELYSCVSELKRYPQSRQNSQGSKYITLDWDGRQHRILTKITVLPSGRTVYVADIEGKVLVSDGKRHHMEYGLSPQGTAYASLMMLWAQVSLGQGLAGVSARQRPVARGPAGAGKGAYCGEIPSAGATTGTPLPLLAGWRDMVLRPVQAFFAALTFPAAAAQDSFDYGNSPVEYHVEEWPDNINDLFADDELPVVNMRGCRALGPETEYEQFINKKKPLVFVIDGKETTLLVPHYRGQIEFERLSSIFSLVITPSDDSLGTLLAFDQYIGGKVHDLFDQGNLLVENEELIHLILLKGRTEAIINDYLVSTNASSLTKHRILKYIKNQVLINHYIKIEIDKLINSFRELEIDSINEAIDLKKGVSFDDAKKSIMDSYNTARIDQKYKYACYYKHILIMQEAKLDYCNELYVTQNVTTLEKVIYNNDKELLIALIEEDNERVNKVIKKRIFYMIYDYTRKNNISLQGEHIIVPGELTKYNAMFEEIDQEIREDEVLNLLSNEITHYCSLENEKSPNIVRLVNVIELLRTSEDQLDNGNFWHEINIMPFNAARKLFYDFISGDLVEKTRMVWPKTWYDDYKKQLMADKISYLMLEIIISIQREFNVAVTKLLRKRFNEVNNEEQRIFQAKIAAVELALPPDIKKGDYDAYLEHYKRSVTLGYFDLLFTASAHWYLSINRANDNALTLRDANVLTLAQRFSEQEHNIATALTFSAMDKFPSVYKLRPSNEFDDKRDYYNQFANYKTHHINREANHNTYYAIKFSSIGYYDLIYRPKETYTFKIFSRKFMQNSLASSPSISIPVTNLGFISLVITQSDRLILISTLSNITIITDITHLKNTMTINRLMDEWIEEPGQLEVRSRKKSPITADEMKLLFFSAEDSINYNDFSLDFLVITPAENEYSNPSPEFSLAAVKEIDFTQTLRNFIVELNRETLIEVSEGLKKSLLAMTWIDFVTAFIPFYHTIERLWYDADMTLKFEDVFFDIFDLLLALVPTGFAISRIPKAYLSTIIIAARSQNIPKHMLKKFFLAELLKHAPDVAISMAKTVSSDLMQYLLPLPLSLHSIINLPMHCYNNLKKNTIFVNSIPTLQRNLKEKFRREWRMNIAVDELIPEHKGIYTLNPLMDNMRHFIIDHDDVFLVKRDEANQLWRVQDPMTEDNANHAIAVIPAASGGWGVNIFDEKIESSLFSSRSMGVGVHKVLTDVVFESSAPVPSLQSTTLNDAEYHLRIIRFFLEEIDLYMKELLFADYSKGVVLSGVADRLSGSMARNLVFTRQDYSTTQTILINDFYHLHKNFETDINFRSVNFWIDENDYDPINHQLIKFIIGENIYILDLQLLRPLSNINTNNLQVNLENNWLLDYKNNFPQTYALIKYKDYRTVNDALSFSQGENISPAKIIDDAYLLREPKWYKSVVLRKRYSLIRKTRPLLSMAAPNIRQITRDIIKSFSELRSFESLAPVILHKAKIINMQQSETLEKQLRLSKYETILASDIIDSGMLVGDLNAFVRINPGKLILFYDPQGLLKHAQVSIGHGRIASAGNTFFDPKLSNGATIMLVEELGEFNDKRLRLRHNALQLNVIVGNIKDAEYTSSVFMPGLSKKKVLAIKDNGEPIEEIVPVSREEMMLGDHWEMHAVHGLKTHIQIKVHGAPFDVNHMDAIEFSHVVRGLMLAKPDIYDLARLQSVDLYSCFSGFGGKYSIAQMLANELKVPVRGYPFMISQAIEQRHPNWFHYFEPIRPIKSISHNRFIHDRQINRLQNLQSRHSRLHDFVEFLLSLRRHLGLTRRKRSSVSIPSIQVALAEMILGVTSYDDFITKFEVEPESAAVLNALLAEYQFQEQDSDDIFLQLYFDIILTVERFRNIANAWLKGL